jgi:hypothetical protein
VIDRLVFQEKLAQDLVATEDERAKLVAQALSPFSPSQTEINISSE